MRCSTCGEHLLHGDDRCATCGAVVGRRSATPTVRDRAVRRCVQCGFRGDGVPYFRRPLHVGLLAAASFMSFGLGGLVYYAACRRRLICPDCGLGWEHARTPEESRSGMLPAWPGGAVVPGSRFARLPRSGAGRRATGIVLGAIGFLIGVAWVNVGFAPTALITAMSFGMAGAGMFAWGQRSLRNRRHAVLHGLRHRVLRLAAEEGGVLTVTQVAARLDLGMTAAERLLVGMDDGLRVRSDVTDEGVIRYEFPELQHRARLGEATTASGSAAAPFPPAAESGARSSPGSSRERSGEELSGGSAGR